MRETPLFLGLTRPTKVFGLPIGYFISLSCASVIPFVAFDDMRFLLVFVVAYPVLWIVADRHPNLFRMLGVTISRTPRTRNHRLDGGDRYVG